LLDGERVEETIHFAPQATAKLTYALERESSVVAPTVRYIEGAVRIPADQAITWCLTDQVSIVEIVSLGPPGGSILCSKKTLIVLIGVTKITKTHSQILMPGQHANRGRRVSN
jgi:hypothetical protein